MSEERASADPELVDPTDVIFTGRPTFCSDTEDLSERVDELLYGKEA